MNNLKIMVAAVMLSLAFHTAAPAQFTTVTDSSGHTLQSASLTGSGNGPMGGLTLYGNTFYGTTNGGGDYDSGTVFSMTAAGYFSTIASFDRDGPTGAGPSSHLTLYNNALYGTTTSGMNYDNGGVFSVTSSGNLSAISFPYYSNVGASGLTLIGNTFYGTRGQYSGSGQSSVYSMTPGGAETTLVTFTGSNGSLPISGLTANGNGSVLYGTTSAGGAYGAGTIFSVTPSGSFSTLYNFTGSPGQGATPEGGMVLVGNTLYGTTYGGGNTAQAGGTVFSLTLDGTFTQLYTFQNADGYHPTATLAFDDGLLYGTTGQGGIGSGGTLFSLTLSGSLTTLFNFDTTYGRYPAGDLLIDNGILYGTTLSGGNSFKGTVFALELPTPVPEPAYWASIVTGLLALMVFRRRLSK